MIVFSGIALYLTSLWNQGFQLNLEPETFGKTVLLVALFYYLVLPISRIILIPINFLTLGLLSSLLYFLLFYIFITKFSLVKITAWTFPGVEYLGYTFKSFPVSYLLNIAFSSVSLSFIIKLLELLL